MEDQQSNFTILRLIRWFGAISIIPGIILPIYQQFLHGGRLPEEIVHRSTAYASAHMLGALCSALLVFGLIAIFMSHRDKVGKLGLIAFIFVLLGQILDSGVLMVDGVMNPLMAAYDPTWSNFNNIIGPAISVLIIAFLAYFIGYILFGIMIIRAKLLPSVIGWMYIIAAPLMATSFWTPKWVSVIAYAGTGLGTALAGYLLWKNNKITNK